MPQFCAPRFEQCSPADVLVAHLRPQLSRTISDLTQELVAQSLEFALVPLALLPSWTHEVLAAVNLQELQPNHASDPMQRFDNRAH